MAISTQATLLRRMIRPQGDPVADNPLTSSRAVRLALTKAAHESIGLVLTVTSVAEAEGTLDETLAALDDDLLLVELLRRDGLVGLAAIDQELRTAIVEMQTIGALIPKPAVERRPTATDAFLSLPLLQAFLGAFPATVAGTSLDGWGDDVLADAKIPDLRTAGLMLADVRFRTVQMSVDFGVADRQGVLQIVLPVIEIPVGQGLPKPSPVDWHSALQDSVMEAPAGLEALLHRVTLPLAALRRLKVGDVLPLTGCTVSSVRLLAADGQTVAQAKLGQMGGMRALRLEPPPAPQLTELDAGSPPPESEMLLPEAETLEGWSIADDTKDVSDDTVLEADQMPEETLSPDLDIGFATMAMDDLPDD